MDNKYTEKSLKQQFSSFNEAKAHFSIKASSWKALAEKLNRPKPSPEELLLEKQVAELKGRYSSFDEAKAQLGIKARSWDALIQKLNKPSPEQEIAMLKGQVEALKAEVKRLREAGENAFDEVGFWLLDRNFDRAKFEDFGVSEKATEMESEAKKIYIELSQRYHPDNGGLDEQQANINKLRKQMLAVVKLNGGMGL
ncbi:hypothetical protein SPB21_03585 [Leptothoe sp. ISB3NOV94-8A]